MAHEELKKIYELDAAETDTPWFLWEFCLYPKGEWFALTRDPAWAAATQYRRKQPREKMKEINNHREFMQALLDGETVMNANGDDGCWVLKDNKITKTEGLVSIPDYFPVYIKPKTININGFEVPEPLREISDDIDTVWSFDHHRAFCIPSAIIEDKNSELLKLGVIHSNKENAEAHRNALLSFTMSDDK